MQKVGVKMQKAYIIGIAGGSAGGKTTFARQLQTALADIDVLLLSMDAYFAGSRATVGRRKHGAALPGRQLPGGVRSAASAARRGRGCGSGGCRVLIVEGLLTLWDRALYEMLDLRLYVDCRADERIVRRLRRNMQWGCSFDEIADVYLDLVRTRHDEFVEPEPVAGGSGRQRQRMHGRRACRPYGLHPHTTLSTQTRRGRFPFGKRPYCLLRIYGFSAAARFAKPLHRFANAKQSSPPASATASQSRIVPSHPNDSENAAIP